MRLRSASSSSARRRRFGVATRRRSGKSGGVLVLFTGRRPIRRSSFRNARSGPARIHSISPVDGSPRAARRTGLCPKSSRCLTASWRESPTHLSDDTTCDGGSNCRACADLSHLLLREKIALSSEMMRIAARRFAPCGESSREPSSNFHRLTRTAPRVSALGSPSLTRWINANISHTKHRASAPPRRLQA